MNYAEPVNLVAALVVAAFGVLLFAGLLGTFFLQLRRKGKMRDERPPFDVDEDVRKYLDRVYLLIEAWRPDLDDATEAQIDTLWQEVLDEVEALQAARNAEDDAPEHVARLIDLEEEIEQALP